MSLLAKCALGNRMVLLDRIKNGHSREYKCAGK